MQLGNRRQLDHERNTLRDQFDAIWLRSTHIGPKEERAIQCAIKLDKPRYQHNSPNWTIFKGGRLIGPHNSIIFA
jgi:hypothetical protein